MHDLNPLKLCDHFAHFTLHLWPVDRGRQYCIDFKIDIKFSWLLKS